LTFHVYTSKIINLRIINSALLSYDTVNGYVDELDKEPNKAHDVLLAHAAVNRSLHHLEQDVHVALHPLLLG
jgi:hypothetical protein